VILTTEHRAPESAFGPIVVERNARVVEKARQPRPQPEQITDGLPQAALWQRPLGQRPRLNLANDRARALIAASDGTVERRPASSSFRRVAWVKIGVLREPRAGLEARKWSGDGIAAANACFPPKMYVSALSVRQVFPDIGRGFVAVFGQLSRQISVAPRRPRTWRIWERPFSA